MKIQNFQSGQILLIVLLVLTVATTVALSLVARTTIDQNISSQVEESSRAFNAAEAGIEEALQKQATGVTNKVYDTATNTSVNVSCSNIEENAGVYVLPRPTNKGNVETVWLTGRTAANTFDYLTSYNSASLTVCWKKTIPTDPDPAIVGTIVYTPDNGVSFYTGKVAYDSSAARAGTTNMTAVTTAAAGCPVSFLGTTITFANVNGNNGSGAALSPINPMSDKLVMLRLRPMFTNVQFAVAANVPQQGLTCDSSGKTGSGVTRRIVVDKQYRSAPAIFDYALYSQTAITK